MLSAAGLVNGAGEKVSLESITGAGKYLGLYFSAHWCVPLPPNGAAGPAPPPETAFPLEKRNMRAGSDVPVNPSPQP